MVEGIGGSALPLRLPQELPDAQTVRRLPDAVTPAEANGSGGSFGASFKQFLGEVNNLQLRSDEVLGAFVRGEVTDLHQVALAQQEAAIALRLVSEMRDRMLAAYQEVMRTTM
jgi:flagellar hook-basal body complex protein FliE